MNNKILIGIIIMLLGAVGFIGFKILQIKLADPVIIKQEPLIPAKKDTLPSEVVKCGEVGSNIDPAVIEEVKKCIEEKFKECKPATLIASIDLGSSDSLVVYYYEIIGPSNNLCAIKSKFLENPNPDWINKEMICEYDNTVDFNTAIQDMSKCEGLLYDLMME